VAAARAGSRTGAAVFIPAAAAVRMKRAYRNMASMMGRPARGRPVIFGAAAGPARYRAAAACATGRQPAPTSCMRFSEARNSIQPSW
jgi:hypothetical protein